MEPSETIEQFFAFEGYDSYRYGHDAYVYYSGQSSVNYNGVIISNPFIVFYAIFLFETFYAHPIVIGLSNCIISVIGSLVLFGEIKRYTKNKRVHFLYWLSQLLPVILVYEAVLGKEVFYLTAIKLSFCAILMLYRAKFKSIFRLKFWLLLVTIFFFGFAREVIFILPIIVLTMSIFKGFVFRIVIVSLMGVVILVNGNSKEDRILKQIEWGVKHQESKNAVFQKVKELTSSETLQGTIALAPARMGFYVVYPFPLVIPTVWKMKLSSRVPAGTYMITYSEQISALLIILFSIFMFDKCRLVFFSREDMHLCKEIFIFSVLLLWIIAIVFPFLHARYRIFNFMFSFGLIYVIYKARLFLSSKRTLAH